MKPIIVVFDGATASNICGATKYYGMPAASVHLPMAHWSRGDGWDKIIESRIRDAGLPSRVAEDETVFYYIRRIGAVAALACGDGWGTLASLAVKMTPEAAKESGAAPFDASPYMPTGQGHW